MKSVSRDYSIAVVVRTFHLLEALAEAGTPLGLTDLAQRAGTTKSAAYRILATLEQGGYITKDPISAKYRLGVRLAYLGQNALGMLDLRQVARPTLTDLHRRFRETVNLAALEDGCVVYIDMLESDHDLRMTARIGAREHLYCTALGKAILAFLPEERLEMYLRQPMQPRTAKTITAPDVLRRQLAQIQSVGVATDYGENEDGACCFGAPIFDQTANVVAAVSISGPESRLAAPRATEITEAVRDAALNITARMGGRPHTLFPTGPRAANGEVHSM